MARLLKANGKRCSECGGKPKYLIAFAKQTPSSEVFVCKQCLVWSVRFLSDKEK